MRRPLESFEAIARDLEAAMDPNADPRDVRMLLIGAHTSAVIQCVSLRRERARETFAAYPQLEQGLMQ